MGLRHRWTLFATGCAAYAAAALACNSSNSSTRGQPGPAGGDAGTGDVPGALAADAEGMFRAFQADLVAKCGGNNGQCHVSGTFMGAPQWLGPPDPYVSAKNYPGNIPDSNDPLDSKLLTQVEHEGPALVSSPDLFDKVRAWVVAEIAVRGSKLPATDAMTIVDGPNTFDLSKLVGGLTGATITFTASNGTGLLTILNMQITAPFPKSLHVESPFFVIVPASGPVITDTIDGFPGPLDVDHGTTVDFYGGSAVLKKWAPTSKLKIVFNKLDAVLPDDAGAGTVCNALDAFKTSATPAFKIDLMGETCFGCHAGSNEAAQFAMDLGKLDTDPATACAQAKNRIVPKNPTASQILLTPTGDPQGDPFHPVRTTCPTLTQNDAGPSLCVPQAYVDGLTAWINAEN
jgi:hypothetical protein